MTKNRRAKQDARKQASATAVSYTQALRETKLDGGNSANPILREWARALLSGELALPQLLSGWTVDGAGTEKDREEAREEMLLFELRFSNRILTGGKTLADEPIRSTVEGWRNWTNIEDQLDTGELTVWELGEYGGLWFIEGTLDLDEAAYALRKWLLYVVPESIHEYDSLFQPDRLNHTPRSDWFWCPVDQHDPESEAELCYLEKHGDQRPVAGSAKTFIGTLIQE